VPAGRGRRTRTVVHGTPVHPAGWLPAKLRGACVDCNRFSFRATAGRSPGSVLLHAKAEAQRSVSRVGSRLLALRARTARPRAARELRSCLRARVSARKWCCGRPRRRHRQSSTCLRGHHPRAGPASERPRIRDAPARAAASVRWDRDQRCWCPCQQSRGRRLADRRVRSAVAPGCCRHRLQRARALPEPPSAT
jgi:hypothetical protein